MPRVVPLDDSTNAAKERAEKGLFRIEHILIVVEHAPVPIGAALFHDAAPFLGAIGSVAIIVFFGGTMLAYYGRPIIVKVLAALL